MSTVDRPALLHFDLWDGNVLAVDGGLTALVDGERGGTQPWSRPADQPCQLRHSIE